MNVECKNNVYAWICSAIEVLMRYRNQIVMKSNRSSSEKQSTEDEPEKQCTEGQPEKQCTEGQPEKQHTEEQPEPLRRPARPPNPIARILELRQKGLWSRTRLPMCVDPPRSTTHHDYFLREMEFMAEDFKVARAHKRRHAQMIVQEISIKRKKGLQVLQAELTKYTHCSAVAGIIREFWNTASKLTCKKRRSATIPINSMRPILRYAVCYLESEGKEGKKSGRNEKAEGAKIEARYRQDLCLKIASLQVLLDAGHAAEDRCQEEQFTEEC